MVNLPLIYHILHSLPYLAPFDQRTVHTAHRNGIYNNTALILAYNKRQVGQCGVYSNTKFANFMRYFPNFR